MHTTGLRGGGGACYRITRRGYILQDYEEEEEHATGLRGGGTSCSITRRRYILQDYEEEELHATGLRGGGTSCRITRRYILQDYEEAEVDIAEQLILGNDNYVYKNIFVVRFRGLTRLGTGQQVSNTSSWHWSASQQHVKLALVSKSATCQVGTGQQVSNMSS